MATRSHSPRTPGRKPGRNDVAAPQERAASRSARTTAQRSTPSKSSSRTASSTKARRAEPPRRSSSQTPVRGTATSIRGAAGRSHVAPAKRRAAPSNKRSAARAVEANRPKVSAPSPEKRARQRGVASPLRRLRITLVAIAVVLLAIVGRVAYLQTKEADSLQSAGADQWTRSYSLSAQRGTMFDRHGNELAMSVPAASISINPKLLVNGAVVIQELDTLLDLSDEQVALLLSEVESKDRGFVYVARQVDANAGDFIRALGHAGVNVDDESRREMPGGDTGRSVLGRTNIDGDGIAGLEKQYNDVMTGTGGSMTREVDPKQQTIAGSESITQAPVAGNDLVLTIDRSIQFATEQVLLEQLERIGAKGGTVIALETKSGEILGMASVRRDDQTGEYGVTNGNFAAVDAYEPGSVAKVITIAGALDAGAVTPETDFTVPWRKQYADDLLKDSHEHPDQLLTVSDILTESSNIGTIMVQQELGRYEHYDYMTAFGLGSKTALDFPGESPGLLKDVDDLWGSERVTVAYGQGMSSTSLQLVSAINVIANGGVYVAPKLVKATVGPEGQQTPMPATATHRVVSKQAAAETTAMMQRVVCEGTAKLAQVDDLSVAGKTGTAFKAADNGTYFNEEGDRIYYASFVGFFPADNPQITILVSVDEPPAGTSDRFGGTAAAPVFAALVPTLLHERNIQPAPGSAGCPE
ncbi:MAG: cell division protein FtsI (penicillin-binding protein 3) [Candidatus Azotimanducaceae bacterium]|jgi:cell division protein FtsI (penicillin-binding protein 3)